MNKPTIKIYPSLIAADPLGLAQVIDALEPHCQGFHIDVMDNHFVPNLTWGSFMVNAIAAYAQKPLFVHLMIEKPLEFIEHLQLKSQSIVSFHIESSGEILKTIDFINEKKWVPCLAICPKTPLSEIENFLSVVSMVLLMSVDPGFSGQSFLETAIQRLHALVEYRAKHQLNFEISMDGGINTHNIAQLAKGGCTSFGVASAIFAQPDPIVALKHLYALVQ